MGQRGVILKPQQSLRISQNECKYNIQKPAVLFLQHSYQDCRKKYLIKLWGTLMFEEIHLPYWHDIVLLKLRQHQIAYTKNTCFDWAEYALILIGTIWICSKCLKTSTESCNAWRIQITKKRLWNRSAVYKEYKSGLVAQSTKEEDSRNDIQLESESCYRVDSIIFYKVTSVTVLLQDIRLFPTVCYKAKNVLMEPNRPGLLPRPMDFVERACE